MKRVRLRLAPNSCWDSAEIDYLGFTSEAVSRGNAGGGIGYIRARKAGKKTGSVTRTYNVLGRMTTTAKSTAAEVGRNGLSIPVKDGR